MLAGILQPDFQIAVTHSILKLKSILRPPDKMTGSGEKDAQDQNLIWFILMALRQNFKTTILLKDPVFRYTLDIHFSLDISESGKCRCLFLVYIYTCTSS